MSGVKNLNELYMTAKEAGELLGISKSGTLYDVIKRVLNISPVFKQGHAEMYNREELTKAITEYNNTPKRSSGRSVEELERTRKSKVAANAPAILNKLEAMDEKIDRLLALWG